MSTTSNPVIPPNAPPSGTGSPGSMLISGLLAGAVAVFGLLLTVFTQKPGVILPWALCIFGISSFAPLIPQIPKSAKVIITSIIACALIAASVAVFIRPKLLIATVEHIKKVEVPGPVRTPVPPSLPEVVLIIPSAESGPVDGCFTFSWHGDPPAGWMYAVSTQEPEVDFTYFEGDTRKLPNGDWTATVTLGSPGRGMGKTYQIALIILPQDLHDYLINVSGDHSQTWWAGLGNPPGVQTVKSFNEIRNRKSAIGAPC